MGAGIEPGSSRGGQQAHMKWSWANWDLLLYLSKALPLVDWLPAVCPPTVCVSSDWCISDLTLLTWKPFWNLSFTRFPLSGLTADLVRELFPWLLIQTCDAYLENKKTSHSDHPGCTHVCVLVHVCKSNLRWPFHFWSLHACVNCIIDWVLCSGVGLFHSALPAYLP